MSTVQEATGGDLDLVRKFIGQTVFTNHAGKIFHYRVVGVTDESVECLFVHKMSMPKYFEKKHGVVLLHPHSVALVCRGTNVLPLELAHVITEENVLDF